MRENLETVKRASRTLSLLSEDICHAVLLDLADTLRENTAWILEENKKDLAQMDPENPQYDRLLLTKERLQSIANDVESVVKLPNPLGNGSSRHVLEEIHRPNGLVIKKVAVPLGVVAIIYESRPNVTIDVFSLCFKTRNACVLKGGKEAHHTNVAFVSLIHKILQEHQLPIDLVHLLPSQREATHGLLQAVGLVDVCIPRGSQSLIQFVRENSKIPVIETGAGVVHAYFDKSGDLEKGKKIILNAKTRRVSVCNALDALLIHKERLNDLYDLVKPLIDHQVVLHADGLCYKALENYYPSKLLKKIIDDDYGHEYLSYDMAVCSVNTASKALDQVARYTSGHSEAIIAEDTTVIDAFIKTIDAAALYVNASTAFTDGGEFGMGAEIGISTQKLHARGPMGLDALTSYKWIVIGNGQVR